MVIRTNSGQSKCRRIIPIEGGRPMKDVEVYVCEDGTYVVYKKVREWK